VNNRTTTWALMLAATSILAACGGGGGDDDPPPATAATYSVGGTVTGLTSAGLVLALNGANIPVASGATSFVSSVSFTSGTAYTVTQGTKPATQTCTVTNGTGTVGSANVTNVAVNCVTDTFTVAATVSGLNGTGLVLQLNGGAGLSFAGNVSQTFANRVSSGTAYAVTMQTQPTAPNQQCTVTNGSGPSISANVTNVTVACVNSTGISGVAAVGSPLAGTVTVKDATNTIRGPMPLGSNGSYSIDVSGMTPPFVFRAEGTANGHTYVVHSAAVAADVGGTINITQLTDLVVANIAGQVASAYFDNPNFSLLTPAALNAEVAILKARLLPVLTALGVDASIDLLRSRFTALMDALDDALDILRVSVDTVTNIATITNIVTQQQIQDSIVVPAAAETNPPILTNTGGIDRVATDTAGIRNALNNLAALFATGLPSRGSVEAVMTANFLDEDEDRAAVAAWWASDSTLVGSSFTDIDMKNLDYSNATQPVATIDFTIKEIGGAELYRPSNWQIVKGTDNVWRLHGNQRVMRTQVDVHPYRDLSSGCRTSQIEFQIGDGNSANNGALIDHIIVNGPGLPIAGLRFNRPSVGGSWDIAGTNGSGYTFANTCSSTQPATDLQIQAIPDNAGYTFAAYTSTDNSVRHNFPVGAIASGPNQGMYVSYIEKRPHTLVEIAATTMFPAIASPTAAELMAYTSGSITINATNLNPLHYVDHIFWRNTASGDERSVEPYLPPTSGGTVSTTVSLPAVVSGDVITERSLRIATRDAYRRKYMSGYFFRQYAVSGTVSGLTGTLELSLLGPATPQVITLSPGTTSFTYPQAINTGVALGTSITAQPAGQTCIVTRSAGVVATSNLSGTHVTCVANTTSSLAGTYTGILTNGINQEYLAIMFAPDGRYLFVDRMPDAENCRNISNQSTNNGIEYGVYNWNSTTGVFNALRAVVDTTGDCGFLDNAGNQPFTVNITPVGNTLVVNTVSDQGTPFSTTLTSATNTTGGLLGTYQFPNGRYFTFLADGTYIVTMPQDRMTGAPTNANAIGFEHGCYTNTGTAIQFNVSNTCVLPTAKPAIDMNGGYPLKTNTALTGTIPFTISGDTLTLYSGTQFAFAVTRVIGN